MQIKYGDGAMKDHLDLFKKVQLNSLVKIE